MQTGIVVFLISLIVVAIAFLLLGVKLLLKKGGRFPETSVSKNKALARKGITCVHHYDRIEQQKVLKNKQSLMLDKEKLFVNEQFRSIVDV